MFSLLFRSTSRIVRGEESMSSDFGGMPPQHPIRGNLTYPNIPRDASGEGSSPGEWQGHSPMPSSLPPTVPLASRSPISRRPARVIAEGRHVMSVWSVRGLCEQACVDVLSYVRRDHAYS